MLARLVRRPILSSMMLALVGLGLYLPHLGNGLVARQQELRVILTARDMATGGDWIVPHFMGEERLRKPPLMYWISAASMKMLRSTSSAFVARLPAALAGTMLLVVTAMGGRMLVGRRAAWLGALALATTAGLLRHARLAETDIMQTLMATAATLCVFRSLRPPCVWRWWFLGGLAAGLGTLSKSPAPLAIPIAALAAFAPTTWRKIAGARLALRIGAFIAVTAAVALPWYIIVGLRTAETGSQVASEASLLLAESRHPGPFYYYVYTLPGRLGIWAIPFLFAIPLLWRLRRHAGIRMLAAWIASTFVLLSAMSGKQPHYALLLLPPACLMAGLVLDRALRLRPGCGPLVVRSALVGLAALAGVFALSALVLAGVGVQKELLQPVWPWLGAIAVVCLAALVCPRRPAASMIALTASIGLATSAHAAQIESKIDEDAIVRTVILRHIDEIGRAPSCVVAGPHTAMIAFFARRTVDTAPDWTNAPAGSLLIVSSRKSRPLEIAPQQGQVDEARFKGVQIAVFRKGQAPAP